MDIFITILVIAIILVVKFAILNNIVIKMTGAMPLPQKEAPEIHAILKRLSKEASIPTPKIYSMPSPQPNAFAFGQSQSTAAIGLTDKLMEILNQNEIEGVIAHELAHIKNNDTLISTATAAMAGVPNYIAQLLLGGSRGGWGIFSRLFSIIFAPLAAMLIRTAISRSREFTADKTGAQICKNPESLANALLKMQKHPKSSPMKVSPATSHLFIINPNTALSLGKLFNTHPPVNERVKKLKEMK